MAKIIIKLEKEDILTNKIGINTMIGTKQIDIVFSPEALEEFLKDVENIKKQNKK